MHERSRDLLGPAPPAQEIEQRPRINVSRWLLGVVVVLAIIAAGLFYVLDVRQREDPALLAKSRTECASLVNEERSVVALRKAYEASVNATRWSDKALGFKQKYPLPHAKWDPADLKAKAALDAAVQRALVAYDAAANAYNAHAKGNVACANRKALPKAANGRPPAPEVPVL